jgi:site-specific DNA-methyltransferase (adenine-specific)
MSYIQIYNQDCLEAMASMPDKAFELAIVDPPYGVNIGQVSGGGQAVWFVR